eukprot:6213037-Pleurochrysis_carterae.AAC.1
MWCAWTLCAVERCEREDGGALVGGVDVVPLGLELVDELEPLALLKLAHAARPALVRLLHAPDVLVLVRDLLLDLVQVGRHLAEVGLLGPVDRLRLLLGLGEDVVHRVGRDEVLRLVRLSDRLVLLLALHLLRHRRLRLVLIFERRDCGDGEEQRPRPLASCGQRVRTERLVQARLAQGGWAGRGWAARGWAGEGRLARGGQAVKYVPYAAVSVTKMPGGMLKQIIQQQLLELDRAKGKHKKERKQNCLSTLGRALPSGPNGTAPPPLPVPFARISVGFLALFTVPNVAWDFLKVCEPAPKGSSPTLFPDTLSTPGRDVPASPNVEKTHPWLREGSDSAECARLKRRSVVCALTARACSVRASAGSAALAGSLRLLPSA